MPCAPSVLAHALSSKVRQLRLLHRRQDRHELWVGRELPSLTGPVGNVLDAADLLTHDLLGAGAERRHLTARKVRPDGRTHATLVRAAIETQR